MANASTGSTTIIYLPTSPSENFYITPRMFRLLLILLFSCAVFWACSSDDSSSLKNWFDDQKIAVSYEKLNPEDFEITLKSFACSSSVFMQSSYAALGDTNGVEYTLYFGLEDLSLLSDGILELRTDSLFSADYEDSYEATIYWLKESKKEYDSTWIKLEVEKVFNGFSEETSIEWEAGTDRDAFIVYLPKELQELSDSAFTLLVGIELKSKNAILHIEPPTGVRVAQKTKVLDDCKESRLLHAGAGESLSMFFGMEGINFDKTVMFAELILLKSESDIEQYPIPVYVHGENYKVDSAYVKEYGHSNLVFWEGDTLKLQVTGILRNYAAIGNSRSDSLGFTIRLGNPILQPTFPYYIHNTLFYSSEKIFADRPAYSSYNFGSTLEEAKLRLWFADYGEDKK